jgi:hypothetical protein
MKIVLFHPRWKPVLMRKASLPSASSARSQRQGPVPPSPIEIKLEKEKLNQLELIHFSFQG